MSVQLQDPIKALGQRSRTPCEIALEPKLVKLFIVKGTEFRRYATEHSDKADLRCHKTKPGLQSKLTTLLGFELRLPEGIPRYQKVCDSRAVTDSCKNQIARFICCLKSPIYQVTAGSDVFSPWHDVTGENRIDSGLKSLQSTFHDQVVTELTESKSVRVVS